jgi:hypothetical protein
MNTTTTQPETLAQKALFQKAKARLSGDGGQPAEAFLLANKLGVVSAIIEFNGSGDSGDYEEADLYAAGGEEDRLLSERIDNAEGQYVLNPERTDEHDVLSDLVRQLAEQWVEDTDVDWYNNDGGGGKVEFNFRTGEVSGEVYYYEQVQHTGASREWNLLEDEEEGVE